MLCTDILGCRNGAGQRGDSVLGGPYVKQELVIVKLNLVNFGQLDPEYRRNATTCPRLRRERMSFEFCI